MYGNTEQYRTYRNIGDVPSSFVLMPCLTQSSLVVGIVMLPEKFGRLSTKRKVELRGFQVVIALLNFA